MPDWSYHPVFKPLLFQLPPHIARDWTLRNIGRVGTMPGGSLLLDIMGHMLPLPSERVTVAGWELISRVGLGAGLAWDHPPLQAFSHFGFGLLEIGPVTVSPLPETVSQLVREPSQQQIEQANRPENPGMDAVRETFRRLNREHPSPVKKGVRLSPLPGSTLSEAGEQLAQLSRELGPLVDFVTLDTRWFDPAWPPAQYGDLIQTVQNTLRETAPHCRTFLLVPPSESSESISQLAQLAVGLDLDGVVVGGGMPTPDGDARWYGRSLRETSLQTVREIRAQAPEVVIIGSGGIIEPADAWAFIEAGASLIQLHSGFVFSGPGLPKRINQYFNYKRGIPTAPRPPWPMWLTEGWVGFSLVATGLIVASLLVFYVGFTTVLLPYDEAFLGVSTHGIPTINPRLLDFMQHDRITLAGTSLSGAILFMFLAIFGVGHRHHWAYKTSVIAIGAGFLSFFLYLGFNYFDPLHALVSLLVLPMYLWGVFRPPVFEPEVSANAHNTLAWQRAQVGQLLFVLIGFGLVAAGITIALVGCSSVFVTEDLDFMHTSHDVLRNANPKLVPLIAHDRASFGGCLWAVGLSELLISLQGFKQGQRWAWWALLLGGLPGFLAVFGIHFAIGYTHFIHLFPAYIAGLMFLAALILSYDYLCRPTPNEQ
jgi:dihydroorotate dehydrogenase